VVHRWAEAYRRAWEEADSQGAAALFAEDGTYRNDIYQDWPNQGRAGVAEYWTTVTASQSEATVRIGTPLVDGERAVVEFWTTMKVDDEPVTLKTAHKPVVALPYNFEIHDIVMMALQHHPSEVMYTRAMDHFNWLYAEAAERPKMMAIACHPYLSGQPHRIGHVQRVYRDILSHDGVAAWDGEKILDWYLAPAQ